MLDRARYPFDQGGGEGQDSRTFDPADQNEHELVAADSRRHVAFAAHGQQGGGGVFQHPVAGGMAEGVVDELEAVDVDVEQAVHVVGTVLRAAPKFEILASVLAIADRS